MVKVMIVEDQPMVRLAMEQYLASGKCYQTVASISNAAMAEAVCRKCGADLILMDICTEEDESGLAAAKKIKKALPWVKIVMITSMVEFGFLEKAKEAGADSFWYKDATPEELLAVMDRTMEGESVYPDTTPEVMVGTAKSCEFTRAEIEVLRLVVEGKSYKRIAENLEISHETVKWHISNMLRKTNFDSKTKLAVAVTQKNLGLTVIRN